MNTIQTENAEFKVSQMAETLVGSEIIKLAWEINDKIKNGEKIYNLTIGDFNPSLFPIPAILRDEIIKSYQNNETNYPPADGVLPLRQAASEFIKKRQGIEFPASQFLIAGGSRPLIYAFFQTIIDAGDKVLFPTPSWNNNHYTHLAGASAISVETKAENNFMPTADELKPFLSEVVLLALCSPLNPTGTVFSKEGLKEICLLVVEENKKRFALNKKPLYVLYDQVYWTLTFGETEHVDPVSINADMRPYTLFVDGISKSLAATGVRVGWAFGPAKIIDKMKSILGHVGAWAPKAEQIATANFLAQENNVSNYLENIKKEISLRLTGLYNGLKKLKEKGYPIDVIAPQAAIYLTVKINLIGKKTSNGTVIQSTKDISAYLLNEAKIGIVPFSAFGSSAESVWYRVSVGTIKTEEIENIISSLEAALAKLN